MLSQLEQACKTYSTESSGGLVEFDSNWQRIFVTALTFHLDQAICQRKIFLRRLKTVQNAMTKLLFVLGKFRCSPFRLNKSVWMAFRLMWYLYISKNRLREKQKTQPIVQQLLCQLGCVHINRLIGIGTIKRRINHVQKCCFVNSLINKTEVKNLFFMLNSADHEIYLAHKC